MKKLGLLLVILLLLPVFAFAEEFAFNETIWSASRDEIKAQYLKRPIRDGDYLTYNIPSILGMEAQINYGFTKDDELAFVSYRLYTPFSKSTVHCGNYDAVKQNLKNKYGMPDYDNIYWFTDKATPEAYNDIGKALAARAARFETIWDLRDANINLDMKGQGKEVVISVAYINAELGKKFFTGLRN